MEPSGKVGELVHKQVETFSDAADYVLAEIRKIRESNLNDKIFILTPVEFAASEIKTKLDEDSVTYTDHFQKKVPEELIVRSWEVKALFGNFRYANLIFLGYKYVGNRKKLYSLIKTQFNKGQNFNDLFNLVVGKLPLLAKHYKDINQMFEEEQFGDLKTLYDKTDGGSDQERLENLFRAIENSPDQNINIMSIYKSKGLGAEHVFMIGLTEGIIPNKKDGSDTIEGQRRLFYVGMTRAERNLHLVSNYKIPGKFTHKVNQSDFAFNPKDKLWRGKTSTFVEELGYELIHKQFTYEKNKDQII